MKQFLIVEAGLHGEGDPLYYLHMINALRAEWSGWPPIVFKIQHWCDNESPWFRRTADLHGRPPLASVKLCDLEHIGLVAWEAGFGFAVTFHDQAGAESAFTGVMPPLTHIKLGSFDFAQAPLRKTVVSQCNSSDIGLIASVFGVSDLVLADILAQTWFPKGTVFLTGEARYPSNHMFRKIGIISDFSQGYSAHNVPGLALEYATNALLEGANVIELHVTMRHYHKRPLPGDMCVSLSIDEFMSVAKRVGQGWVS